MFYTQIIYRETLKLDLYLKMRIQILEIPLAKTIYSRHRGRHSSPFVKLHKGLTNPQTFKSTYMRLFNPNFLIVTSAGTRVGLGLFELPSPHPGNA